MLKASCEAAGRFETLTTLMISPCGLRSQLLMFNDDDNLLSTVINALAWTFNVSTSLSASRRINLPLSAGNR